MIAAGSVRCVDLVAGELAAREEEIHRWAKSQVELFVQLTPDIQTAVRDVLSRHPRLIGVGSGRSGADPFVIAAGVGNGVVVTEETLSRNIEKPKIPDVCDALGVRRLTLMGFVQEQGWVFR